MSVEVKAPESCPSHLLSTQDASYIGVYTEASRVVRSAEFTMISHMQQVVGVNGWLLGIKSYGVPYKGQ